MNDNELTSTWTALEPTAQRRRRVETRVFGWLEAHETSLASEWFGLLSVHPVTALALVIAAAFSLVFVTPLGSIASIVLLAVPQPALADEPTASFGSGGPPVAIAAVSTIWNGVYTATMPSNNPSYLSDQEYADIIAYMLSVSGVPAGGVELPTDRASLARVLIRLTPERGRSRSP